MRELIAKKLDDNRIHHVIYARKSCRRLASEAKSLLCFRWICVGVHQKHVNMRSAIVMAATMTLLNCNIVCHVHSVFIMPQIYPTTQWFPMLLQPATTFTIIICLFCLYCFINTIFQFNQRRVLQPPFIWQFWFI